MTSPEKSSKSASDHTTTDSSPQNTNATSLSSSSSLSTPKQNEEPPSKPNKPQVPDLSKTQEVHNHYVLRYQKKNLTSDWVPYDPTSSVEKHIKKEEEPEDSENYFYLNKRWYMSNATPILVLSDFSKPLLNFLRSTIGGKSFYLEPEIDIADLFPHFKSMRKELEKIGLATKDGLTFEEKLRLAEKMGNWDATSEYEIGEYLSTLSEHLEVLVECLSEHFKLIANLLELATRHGHIEFDLLQYFFEPGQYASTMDTNFSLPIALEITEAYYCTSVFGGKSFEIKGRGLEWDGTGYSWYEIERSCDMFEGTKEISKLPFNRVSPELKEILITRGHLYTKFAGIHHQVYEGSRVIVDRQAYDSREGYIHDPEKEIPVIDENLLQLLPPQVYGLNLAQKSWKSFLVNKLEPVIFDQDAWDHLVLDNDTKRLIKGLVTVTRKNNSFSKKMITDVISGKSGGMIAVLHGPPGTGKTLTAEAVAEILQRPLYVIGFSELGNLSQRLEEKLRSILSLATTWDAVLLIDEADVFLEQRSLHELERNAMVSAALRVLEYHRGVLFLTTNRIKTFDEAFLSRFSIAIAYPELDQAGRYKIWEKFFKLAEYKVCDSTSENNILRAELEELAQNQFNGRTIKNLVRTAQALALSETSPLKIEHVNTVVRAQRRFMNDFAHSKNG